MSVCLNEIRPSLCRGALPLPRGEASPSAAAETPSAAATPPAASTAASTAAAGTAEARAARTSSAADGATAMDTETAGANGAAGSTADAGAAANGKTIAEATRWSVLERIIGLTKDRDNKATSLPMGLLPQQKACSCTAATPLLHVLRVVRVEGTRCQHCARPNPPRIKRELSTAGASHQAIRSPTLGDRHL